MNESRNEVSGEEVSLIAAFNAVVFCILFGRSASPLGVVVLEVEYAEGRDGTLEVHENGPVAFFGDLLRRRKDVVPVSTRGTGKAEREYEG